MTDLGSARALFFEYLGSKFYMSRNGADVEYARYQVPPELENQWRAELTAGKLAQLDEPGNEAVVYYLWHCGDARWLPRLLQTKPLGTAVQRVMYLESLMLYIKYCAAHYPISAIGAAVEYLLAQADILTAECDPRMCARVRAVAADAAALRSALPPE